MPTKPLKTNPTPVDGQAIAVIGVGARMPGAASAREFFDNICHKVCSITEVQQSRWDASLYYDPDPSVPDRTYSKIGGFLDEFKPTLRKWRIPPAVARSLDGTQLLALDVTEAALRDAGLDPATMPRDRCAVILGNSMGGDLRDHTTTRLAYSLFERQLRRSEPFGKLAAGEQEALLAELRAGVLDQQPPITEDTMAGELSNVVAGRVAAAYRLTGPNFSVDAACAASLAAVTQAVRSLRDGECDLAVTGGVDRNMGVAGYIKFCKTHALSAKGTAPFDERADGFVMGEGGGVLILKRYTDALADGDRVRAVIRGVGASSDGGARGITAPSAEGQLLAIHRAWQDAGLDPQTVGIIEAHGTSTRVGDAVEVETLCQLFAGGDRTRGAVAVGSVKSNIGHLKSAAGAASLVKMVLALHEKVLPPSANFERPNEALRRQDLPIRVQTEVAPWDTPDGLPRRAGVNAFGFGGTNFHVVLEEHLPDAKRAEPEPDPTGTRPIMLTERPRVPITAAPSPDEVEPLGLPEVGLLRLGADSREALSAELATLAGALQAKTDFAELTRRYGKPVDRFSVRAAITAADVEELAERVAGLQKLTDTGKGGLRLAGAGTHLSESAPGKLAFLFPGQGSQYVGMLADLKDWLPEVRDTLDEADRGMASLLEHPLSDYMFGRVSAEDGLGGADAAALALQQTTVTQPAVLAADVALLRVLTRLGLQPDLVAGHSLGEYAAGVAAGVMDLPRALQVVAARGREMADAVPSGADPGRMAVVAAPVDRITGLLEQVDGYVVAANKNSPSQTVIAGASAAVERALTLFEQQGLMSRPIPVSHAFHSNVVAAASEPLRRVLARSGVKSATRPIYSNVTAALYPEDADDVMDLLARQVASPVEFIGIVEAMHRAGARSFVEIGPKKALTGFVRDILGKRPHRATHTLHPKKGGPRSLVEALALLAAEGHPVGATRLAQQKLPQPSRARPAPEALETIMHDETRETDVWITGIAVGLPGRDRVFGDDHLEALLNGESLLNRLDAADQQPIVDQHIERLVKSADGTGSLEPVTHPDEVMAWAGRAGTLDLVGDYHIARSWDQDRDSTTRLGVAAAFEVLRDAWMPLVEERRSVSNGRSLGQGFKLPAALGRDTGVIFASAFAGYNRLVELMGQAGNGAPFPRSTLLQILGLGHAHIAEVLGAMGPNTLINSACASTTCAVAMAQDWIRAGRCQRVIVVGADDVTSPQLLPWIGGGFLALGAATTERDLHRAAVPFGPDRNGMILGMGAAALLVESAESARERGVHARAEVVTTRLANSAAHPLRLRPEHIADEVDRLVEDATGRLGIDRATLARELVFMSHETYTPARGGSAQAEVDALRKAFGDQAGEVLVVNTKGYTGHAMAAGIEDATVVGGLWENRLPAVANLDTPDPEFDDLTFHRGGPIHRRYALRLAAGFGSQIALTLYRRGNAPAARVDEPTYRQHLDARCGIDRGAVIRDARVLRAPSEHRPSDAGQPDALSALLATVNDEPKHDLTPREDTMPNHTTESETATPTQPITGESVLAALQSVVSERTGYDLEELEPDLELEADLGIDTVKQAEIVGELRDRYGLERDESFRLSDYPTLEDLAGYVATRLPHPTEAATEAPTEVPSTTTATQAPVIETPAPTGVTELEGVTGEEASDEAGVLAALQSVVSKRTGYDLAELEPDLELEADLGIDTVKQAEIVGELRDRYGLERDESFRLSDYPTLEDLAGYVAARLPHPAEPAAERPVVAPPAAPPVPGQTAQVQRIETDLGDGFTISRIGFAPTGSAPSGSGVELPSTSRILVAGGTIEDASQVVEGLAGSEAGVLFLPLDRLLSISEDDLVTELGQWTATEPLSGALNLTAISAGDHPTAEVSQALFKLARALEQATGASPGGAAARPVPFFFTVLGLHHPTPARGDGCPTHETPLAGALAGLTRALAREWAGAVVRVIALDSDERVPYRELGGRLREELSSPRDGADVLWRDGAALSLRLGGDLEAAPLPLDADSVVLITGGSGGLGALMAKTLQARWGCRLALTGLDDLPADPAAPAPTRAELRDRIKATGQRPTPALVSRELQAHDRRMVLHGLLEGLRQHGQAVHYVAADLCDPAQVTGMVESVYQTFGRLDAVIHAAGLERSRPLMKKPPAEYRTVFTCKATSAELLWSALRDRGGTVPSRFLSFSSVAGLFGNPGQTDYASANAALTGVMAKINRAEPRTAALAIHWTGWDDIGMTANSPIRELLRQRGVDLLPADKGARATAALLGCDLRGEVLVAGGLGELGGHPTAARPTHVPARTAIAPAPTPEPRSDAPATLTWRQNIGQATLRFRLSPDSPWLADHAVDSVALLPAVAGLELMSRAAAAMLPDATVTQVRNARFDRPLKVQPGREITAVVVATRGDEPGEVRTVLTSERVNRAGRLVTQEHFTADIRLGHAPPRRTTEPRAPLHVGRLERHGPGRDEIYRHFFHGPSFQVLRAIRLTGPTGLVAEARGALLSLDGDPCRVAPLAMEAALQAAGFHALLAERSQALPYRLGRMELLTSAQQLESAKTLILRVRAGAPVASEEPLPRFRFDVDILDESGTLLMVCRDVTLIQRQAVEARDLPATSGLLEVVEIQTGSLGRPDALVLDLEAELGPAERRQAVEISHPGRRLEWIAGRLAAKELVRRHLRDRYGLAVTRRGVEVATDPGGAPVAWVPARPGLVALLPALSITHAAGRAVALGVPATEPGVRVGVDLAPVESRPASFEQQWLTDGELALLHDLRGPERDRRVAQLWSLKEAVSKALGLGLHLTTAELEVARLDDDGVATFQLSGLAEQRLQDLGGTELRAAVLGWGEAVLAWACLELGAHTDAQPHPVNPPLQGLREARIQPTR